MTTHTSFFDYGFSAGALTDIGLKRKSNQDEVIVCPKIGFYAVSDGMGGLANGGGTSKLIRQLLPNMVKEISSKVKKEPSLEYAAVLLAGQIRVLSDTIYKYGNKGDDFDFGATLSGVWLVGNRALFVNIGDSRGYLLPHTQETIHQVTKDHNMAAEYVQKGIITKEEARHHPASSVLTDFVGMEPPAMPDVFTEEIGPGDQILLCSDGLHGMMDDAVFPSLMQSSEDPVQVCEMLAKKANALGGKDNIAVVYIKIE